MTVKCITFDLDDTLWAIAPVIHRAEAHFHRWIEENLPTLGRRFDVDQLGEHRANYFSRYPNLHHDLSVLRKNWMARLAEESGYPPIRIEQGFDVFWQQRNIVDLFDGAAEVLQQLKSQYTLGAITNGNADVDAIGLGHHFDFFLTSAMAGYSKPDREIWEAALALSQCQAEEMIHIGDDPVRDVQGAAAMGMKTIWVNVLNREWQGGHRPDIQIDRLDQLPRAIASLDDSP